MSHILPKPFDNCNTLNWLNYPKLTHLNNIVKSEYYNFIITNDQIVANSYPFGLSTTQYYVLIFVSVAGVLTLGYLYYPAILSVFNMSLDTDDISISSLDSSILSIDSSYGDLSITGNGISFSDTVYFVEFYKDFPSSHIQTLETVAGMMS